MVGQVFESHHERFAALREFFPRAEDDDWYLQVAGQRVQIVKKDKKRGGVLQFGTELVIASDGSLSAMLGASPGASTAVWIMLELLQKCFGEKMSNGWSNRLREIIPSYGQSLIEDTAQLKFRRS